MCRMSSMFLKACSNMADFLSLARAAKWFGGRHYAFLRGLAHAAHGGCLRRVCCGVLYAGCLKKTMPGWLLAPVGAGLPANRGQQKSIADKSAPTGFVEPASAVVGTQLRLSHKSQT
ncbi:hypothetical protein PSEUDO8BK_80390 [Pseudomonas sp. 8BK]|nr:hypothetical protein PSEUDO8BK_80390 [Pseudomonas sp. 8BK]